MASTPGFAQNSGKSAVQSGTAATAAATVVPVIPKNPKELMLFAEKVNGLGSIVGEPWHVKVNYQTFDPDGKPKDKGVFEEWWAGPEKYKISYLGNGFSQTEYVNGNQDVTTGDVGWAPLPEKLVGEYMSHPFPLTNQPDKRGRLSNRKRKVAGVSLNCVEPESPPRFDISFHFCFEPDPVIRLEYTPGGLFVAFNNVIRAGDHYLAKEIVIGNAGLTIAKADVVQLEIPAKFEDSQFVPVGHDMSAPVPRVGTDIIPGNRTRGKDPKYPEWAKVQGAQGMVMLQAKISKSGTVEDLKVISGPKALRQAALDAVKTWKYKPYLSNGQPVEVETEIRLYYMF